MELQPLHLLPILVVELEVLTSMRLVLVDQEELLFVIKDLLKKQQVELLLQQLLVGPHIPSTTLLLVELLLYLNF